MRHANDGRVAAVELTQSTPHIADLIANGKLVDIPEAVHRTKDGACLTFDDALSSLMRQGPITQERRLERRTLATTYHFASRWRVPVVQGTIPPNTISPSIVQRRF